MTCRSWIVVAALAACAGGGPTPGGAPPASRVAFAGVHAEGEAFGYDEAQSLQSARLNCCVELDTACKQNGSARRARRIRHLEPTCTNASAELVHCRSRCEAICGPPWDPDRPVDFSDVPMGDHPPYHGRDPNVVVPTHDGVRDVPCP